MRHITRSQLRSFTISIRCTRCTYNTIFHRGRKSNLHLYIIRECSFLQFHAAETSLNLHNNHRTRERFIWDACKMASVKVLQYVRCASGQESGWFVSLGFFLLCHFPLGRFIFKVVANKVGWFDAVVALYYCENV